MMMSDARERSGRGYNEDVVRKAAEIQSSPFVYITFFFFLSGRVGTSDWPHPGGLVQYP